MPDDQARHAGHAITQAAAESGTPPGEWTLDLLHTSELQIGAHLDRPEFTDTDLHQILTHPRHAAGSDGIYQGQHPHPRANGVSIVLVNGTPVWHDGGLVPDTHPGAIASE